MSRGAHADPFFADATRRGALCEALCREDLAALAKRETLLTLGIARREVDFPRRQLRGSVLQPDEGPDDTEILRATLVRLWYVACRRLSVYVGIFAQARCMNLIGRMLDSDKPFAALLPVGSR